MQPYGGCPPKIVAPAPSPASLNVVDIRTQLPRNSASDHGPNSRRPLSQITLFGWHWDGGPYIPDGYTPLTYYISEAMYHINKDWGGGSYGDGLMYHGKLARDGTLYITRDLEDELWAAVNANPIGMWVCIDSTDGSPLTDAQKRSMPMVEDEMIRRLGHSVPITGHGLLTQYGNNTTCPGPEVLAYLRNGRRF